MGTVLKWLDEQGISKRALLIGGGIAAGVTTCATVWYLIHRRNKRRKKCYADLDDSDAVSDLGKRILVLGLDGAGKSSFLSHLSRPEGIQQVPEPTEGFNVVCVNSGNGLPLNFWEIGGSKTVRSYWHNFLNDTHVLVFVVDSTDIKKLHHAAFELKQIIRFEQMKNVPVLVLANKQDLPDARTLEDISDVIGITGLQLENYKVQILPLQVPCTSSASQETVLEAKKAIIKLVHEH